MSSWDPVAEWYDTVVSKEGHYYHQHVVIPGALKLLNLQKGSSLLDLACGQGVLARHVKGDYVGVDGSKHLIQLAKKHGQGSFHVHDLREPLHLQRTFSHATILLALQNLSPINPILETAARHLDPEGCLVIVLNHPCFRIPRQSHWGVDESKKLQYRRLDSYLSPQAIPITTHPGQKNSSTTLSYHLSLTDLMQACQKAGLAISALEEWISDKVSTGKKAKMENRARNEFPLFLALKLIKL